MMKLIPKLIPPPLQLTAGSFSLKLAKYLPAILIVTAIFGFIDAFYLTTEHFFGDGVRCFLVEGCDIVTTSSYSLLFGQIPVVILGLVFYFIAFLLAVLIYQLQTLNWWKYLFIWSSLGVLASIYFLYIQAIVLQAYCIYCLFSTVFTLVIFSGSGIGLSAKK